MSQLFEKLNFKKTQGQKIRTGKKTAGFTLVEALIYTVLLSMLLVVMTEILVSILASRAETIVKTSAELEGRYVLARLTYDINRASAVITPATMGQNSQTLVLTIDGQNVTYTLQSGNLEISAGSNVDNLNSSYTSITGLNFQRTGNSSNPLVKMALDVESSVSFQGVRDSKTFSTTVGIR